MVIGPWSPLHGKKKSPFIIKDYSLTTPQLKSDGFDFSFLSKKGPNRKDTYCINVSFMPCAVRNSMYVTPQVQVGGKIG